VRDNPSLSNKTPLAYRYSRAIDYRLSAALRTGTGGVLRRWRILFPSCRSRRECTPTPPRAGISLPASTLPWLPPGGPVKMKPSPCRAAGLKTGSEKPPATFTNYDKLNYAVATLPCCRLSYAAEADSFRSSRRCLPRSRGEIPHTAERLHLRSPNAADVRHSPSGATRSRQSYAVTTGQPAR
jgi:hypothetical protein